MPMIDFTYPEGALELDALATAVDRLTESLLRNEAATDNERIRAIAWTFVHEQPGGTIYGGGQPAELPYYRVQFTVPAGTLVHGPGPFAVQARANLFREAAEIVLDAEGTPYADADLARVWCFVQEVAEGHWGGLGTVFGIADISGFASDDLPGTELSERARAALGEHRAKLAATAPEA
jgi:phenylpyruvate tautomerase PptA (4-oxalocrotonate tautomerase family)